MEGKPCGMHQWQTLSAAQTGCRSSLQNPLDGRADRRIGFHQQPPHTCPPRCFHIAFLVADHPALRCVDAVTGNGFLQHQAARLAAKAAAVIGMVRAKTERIDPEAMRNADSLEIIVHGLQRIACVTAFGYAGLVGDDDQAEAGFFQTQQVFRHPGEQGEIGQRSGVIARVVVDYPIAVEKNGFVHNSSGNSGV